MGQDKANFSGVLWGPVNPTQIRAVAVTFLVLAALALAAVSGPAKGERPAAASEAGLACPSDRLMRRVELIFGSAKADGGVVSAGDWNGFLEAEVTPRFPDGLTVLSALGQWRDAAGRIQKEASRILVILYRPADDAERHIESIRSAFKTRFRQESVMRIDETSCVSF